MRNPYRPVNIGKLILGVYKIQSITCCCYNKKLKLLYDIAHLL